MEMKFDWSKCLHHTLRQSSCSDDVTFLGQFTGPALFFDVFDVVSVLSCTCSPQQLVSNVAGLFSVDFIQKGKSQVSLW